MLPLVTIAQTKVQLLYFLSASGSSGTDVAFSCALRQWEIGIVKTGGNVTSRHHLLGAFGALSLAYQALLVQGGCI